MKNNFYFDTSGNDDDAYAKALDFAMMKIKEDPKLTKVIFLVPSKNNTGWLDRLFGEAAVKKMFNGVLFQGTNVKIETVNTYKNNYGFSHDVLICCGLNSKEIFKVQDYRQVDTIVAIPWLKDNTESWIKTSAARKINYDLEIETIHDYSFPEASQIVKQAFRELTSVINRSTGITHPMDNARAKTYVRALYKYEPDLSSDVVCSFLINELEWDVKHANDIRKLIDTLNNGKFFQGGEKTGLQNHYKRWKSK